MNFCNFKSIELLSSLDSTQLMYIKVEFSFFSFTLCLSFYTLSDVFIMSLHKANHMSVF